MKLEECRNEIDAIDSEILTLLNQRAKIVREIGEIKLKAGMSITDWDREAEIIRKVARENDGPLGDEAAARIYRGILRESRQIQLDLAESIARNGEVGL